jgi:AcrR family transcriptional regulator
MGSERDRSTGRFRPGRDDLLHLARKTMLRGDRVDMQVLAAALGVNRVTLYRWVGSRERLMVEVLWFLTQRRMSLLWSELEDLPGPRVPELMSRWTRDTVEAPGLRRFLHGESEVAMRLLTLASGGFQPQLLALVRQRIQDDVSSGRVRTPLPLDELAYAVLRVTESYIYLPVITGEAVDPEMLKKVLSVLVSAAPPDSS